MRQDREGPGRRAAGLRHRQGGYFGALNLAADVSARFKVPQNGGRRTDRTRAGRNDGGCRSARRRSSDWKRSPAKIRKQGGDVHPMQLAALLLENAGRSLSDEDVLGLFDGGR